MFELLATLHTALIALLDAYEEGTDPEGLRNNTMDAMSRLDWYLIQHQGLSTTALLRQALATPMDHWADDTDTQEEYEDLLLAISPILHTLRTERYNANCRQAAAQH